MNRNETVTIAGRVYPARFGIQSAKLIDEKFGGLEHLADKFSKEGTLSEKMDALLFVMEAVIRQGCSYKNIFEPDAPRPENAAVDKDGKYIPITKEDLEIAISFDDFADLVGWFFSLTGKGNKQTIETETEKNTTAG